MAVMYQDGLCRPAHPYLAASIGDTDGLRARVGDDWSACLTLPKRLAP